jgi:hypothetical protein
MDFVGTETKPKKGKNPGAARFVSWLVAERGKNSLKEKKGGGNRNSGKANRQ